MADKNGVRPGVPGLPQTGPVDASMPTAAEMAEAAARRLAATLALGAAS